MLYCLLFVQHGVSETHPSYTEPYFCTIFRRARWTCALCSAGPNSGPPPVASWLFEESMGPRNRAHLEPVAPPCSKPCSGFLELWNSQAHFQSLCGLFPQVSLHVEGVWLTCPLPLEWHEQCGTEPGLGKAVVGWSWESGLTFFVLLYTIIEESENSKFQLGLPGRYESMFVKIGYILLNHFVAGLISFMYLDTWCVGLHFVLLQPHKF